jgi:hypothetical protein
LSYKDSDEGAEMNAIMQAIEEDIRKRVEQEAQEKGVSVEEIEQRDRARAEEANRLTQIRIQQEAAEKEARFQAALDSPDETIPATKAALSRVLKWTSSRYNPDNKQHTIARILDAVRSGEATRLGFECGTYTLSSWGAGYDYTLVIDHRGATLVANFGYPFQRVYRMAS